MPARVCIAALMSWLGIHCFQSANICRQITLSSPWPIFFEIFMIHISRCNCRCAFRTALPWLERPFSRHYGSSRPSKCWEKSRVQPAFQILEGVWILFYVSYDKRHSKLVQTKYLHAFSVIGQKHSLD